MVCFSFDTKARSDGFPEASYHHLLNSESSNEWNCQEPSPSESHQFWIISTTWDLFDIHSSLRLSTTRLTVWHMFWQGLGRGGSCSSGGKDSGADAKRSWISTKTILCTREWLGFPAMSRGLQRGLAFQRRGPQDKKREIPSIFPSSPSGTYPNDPKWIYSLSDLSDLGSFGYVSWWICETSRYFE